MENESEDLMPKFVLNDLVGPPPLDMLPVVNEELWERMKCRQSVEGMNPVACRAELAVVMEKEIEDEWLGRVGGKGR